MPKKKYLFFAHPPIVPEVDEYYGNYNGEQCKVNKISVLSKYINTNNNSGLISHVVRVGTKFD